jgi:hypothetical protein
LYRYQTKVVVRIARNSVAPAKPRIINKFGNLENHITLIYMDKSKSNLMMNMLKREVLKKPVEEEA